MPWTQSQGEKVGPVGSEDWGKANRSVAEVGSSGSGNKPWVLSVLRVSVACEFMIFPTS